MKGKRGKVFFVGAVLASVASFYVASAQSAPCPSASVSTVCAEYTEPAGVTNLRGTVVTISKNGVALAPVTIPASAPTGGAVQSTAVDTAACESATYTVSAHSEYSTPLGVMRSLVVNGTPGAGVVKDRTSEQVCFKAPTNFTVR